MKKVIINSLVLFFGEEAKDFIDITYQVYYYFFVANCTFILTYFEYINHKYKFD